LKTVFEPTIAGRPQSLLIAGLQRLLARPWALLPVVFIVVLAYLFLANPWYPAAKLHVAGKIDDVPARVMINWTSGHGLNGYEMYRYQLEPFPGDAASPLPVTITRTGNRHNASNDTQVVLSRISVDGKDYPLPADMPAEGLARDGDLLEFSGANARLSLALEPRHHVRFEFLAYNYAGEVEIDFAGRTSRHLLYSAWDRTPWTRDSVVVVDYWLVQPDGSFAVSMDMPRYPVENVKISAKRKLRDLDLSLAIADGQLLHIDHPIPTADGAVYQIGALDDLKTRLFHPHRFAFQLFFAALTTWMLFGLANFVARFRSLSELFVAKGRYVFWGMLITGVIAFAFWHISFWPGVTSTDSLKIWRAAHIPGMYLGDHPPLNVVLYMYLAMLWDNVAVVPAVQNILTAVLIAWIFFSMYRWGVPLTLVLPFFLMVAASVPLGMYTTILWKDVPFGLGIVFLGFRLADMYFTKRYGDLKISWQSWLVMSLIILALAGLRYNGAAYLVVFPSLLFLLGIVRVGRRTAVGICCLIAAAGLFYAVSQYAGLSAARYFTQQSGTYLGQLKDQLSGEFLRERAKQYLGIFDINQTAMQWDHVGNCLYGRYDNNMLRRLRWNDVYQYQPLPRNALQKKMARTAFALYEMSYQRPWVYFSWNPAYMLLLLPLLPLLIRKLPMSAVFASFILVEVVALVLIGIFNWRYYFFAHFGTYFLIPLICADLLRKKASFHHR
jgi:hypothetical protein